MTDLVTQLGIGGILVLLVVREFLTFLARRRPDGAEIRRPSADNFEAIQRGVDAVLVRLDRIVERLEDVADATRAARKQSIVTGEIAERMSRAVASLEETLNETLGRRRTVDTNPGV